MIDLILGTAGHIDHGKTALIRALTGVDTDRLPEEKRRGITIELGFAELVLGDIRLGIVDVPGHERFVRQMLAGATGMDLVMLVVAADDSVKPQTREHMDVLRLLDVSHGLIVLTKCDLADSDWIDLVEHEVTELVAGSFLQDAPRVRTSAVTAQGLDTLRAALADVARQAHTFQQPRWEGVPFRMAVDRAFSLPGHGTVVTGSVASGSVRVGETLQLQPVNLSVRVRGLHNHDRPAEEVHRGQRAAINLAGANLDQLDRGFELAAPNYLSPSRIVTVSLSVLANSAFPVKNLMKVRLHLGTASVPATVRLLSSTALQPGQHGFAQLILRSPLACLWNQPFVLRSESPVATLGGGQVLVPKAERIRRLTATDCHHLERLRWPRPDMSLHDLTAERDRLASAIYFAGAHEFRSTDVHRLAGISHQPAALQEAIHSGELVEIPVSPGRAPVVHRDTLQARGSLLLGRLARLHDQHPLQTLFELTALTAGLGDRSDDLPWREVLRWLAQQGEIRLVDQRVGLRDRQPQLSAAQQRLLQELVLRLERAGLAPPSLAELGKEHTRPLKDIMELLACAAADGSVVRVAKDYYLHRSAEANLREQVRAAFDKQPHLTVSQIREHLGTSRKYAVPFCEYLDQVGMTRRHGDQRVLT